jgi:MoaA/NifB/PqqE/SkfB family radical SAM enzyme
VNVRKFGFCLQYGVRTVLLRQTRPLLLAVVITDRCNLDCFYCQGSNAGKIHCSVGEIRDILRQAYERGHRALYFTGGEPMLWESDGWNMNDVVRHARELGFFDVFIFTNGTVPLKIPGCRYIVTVDGPREVHNRIRQGTWELVIENVRGAPPGSVGSSITLTRENEEYFEQYVRDITALGIFSGISFNFLTACPEEMARQGLLGEQRTGMLDRIWDLKAQGYPLRISKAGYKALRANTWKRPIRQVELATHNELFTCCRQGADPRVCEQCGYAACAEIEQMLSFKPSAIWQVLRLTA